METSERELKRPEPPDDFYLGSMIASLIDDFIASQGIQAILNPKTAIGLTNEYHVFLSQAMEVVAAKQHVLAFIYLKDLGSLASYGSIASDSILSSGPLTQMITDRLAMEILIKFKEQVRELNKLHGT
jgi:transcriptional regulatory protein LevR